MNSKVSILIPCYNAERWVAQAIQSALDQTHQDKEVIVVDDGSTDGSLDIIKSFGDKIRWETGPNRGGNIARNRLLELSSGEWLQYLDADDYLLRDKISDQVDFLGHSPNEVQVLFSPTYFEEWESTRTSKPLQKTKFPATRDPWMLLAMWQLPQTGGPLWRRNFLASIGGWNPNLLCCQEHELYLRSLKNGVRCEFYNRAGAVYRYWSSNSVSRKMEITTKNMVLNVLNEMHDHLSNNSMLTLDRSTEINLTQFRIARWMWSHEGQYDTVVKLILTKQEHFEPQVNSLYDLIFLCFGFNMAEYIALIGRSILPKR